MVQSMTLDQANAQVQKTIGVIGGVSWESTLLYYQLINEAIRERLGGLRSAKLLIYNFDYQSIVELERQDRWDEVGEQLGNAARVLQDGGADFLILCCNTLHKVTPSIEKSITIPFFHIADATGSELSNKGIEKVGLLGTQFTMEDGFYASRLSEKFGLEVLTPGIQDRKLMDSIIYNELCVGVISLESKKEVIRMIESLQQNGAEAVLLGCTELGMLIKKDDSSIPVYDTTLLHANQAVNISLSSNHVSK
jgi:aspartate racemase